VQGHKPLRAKKLAYDKEPIFQQRLRPVMENRTGLTTAHDWVAVRALGRLETTAAGTVRVAPIDQAQGELELTKSERAGAGFSANVGGEQPPRTRSPGGASPNGTAKTTAPAAEPSPRTALVKDPSPIGTPLSPSTAAPEGPTRPEATHAPAANAQQEASSSAPENTSGSTQKNAPDPAQDVAIDPKPDEAAELTSVPGGPAGRTTDANGAFGSEPSAARRPALNGSPPTLQPTGRPFRRRPSLGGA
jgi:hypothetical protein